MEIFVRFFGEIFVINRLFCEQASPGFEGFEKFPKIRFVERGVSQQRAVPVADLEQCVGGILTVEDKLVDGFLVAPIGAGGVTKDLEKIGAPAAP